MDADRQNTAQEVESIRPENYRKIVILTGAGVSVASGLGTYRGATAIELKKGPPTVGMLRRDPGEIWNIFSSRRDLILQAGPNPAHLCLARLEERLAGQSKFTLITQNVDGFHGNAGSKNLVELHGNLLRTRCSNPDCDLEPYDDTRSYSKPPPCPNCGAFLRPDVVLFGEKINMQPEEIEQTFAGCELFISAGTSGSVQPAAGFVKRAKFAGARTLFVNLESPESYLEDFDQTYPGKAEELLPALLA